MEYLRNFVKGLQKNVGFIEETLRLLDPGLLERVLKKVNDYEMSIPRMDVEVSREMIEEKTMGRFENIRNWFVAEGGQENEAGRLLMLPMRLYGESPGMLLSSAKRMLWEPTGGKSTEK